MQSQEMFEDSYSLIGPSRGTGLISLLNTAIYGILLINPSTKGHQQQHFQETFYVSILKKIQGRGIF